MKEFFRRLLAKRKAERQDEVVRDACDLYQIAEFNGELWMTFSGHPVCPCCMFSDTPVEAVAMMRKLYVERNTVELWTNEK